MSIVCKNCGHKQEVIVERGEGEEGEECGAGKDGEECGAGKDGEECGAGKDGDVLTYNRMRSTLTITSPKLSEKIVLKIHSLPPPRGFAPPETTENTLVCMMKYINNLEGINISKLLYECSRLTDLEHQQLLIDVSYKLIQLHQYDRLLLMKNLMKTAKTFNMILPNEKDLFKKTLNIQLAL
jgi:hypothetical protein